MIRRFAELGEKKKPRLGLLAHTLRATGSVPLLGTTAARFWRLMCFPQAISKVRKTVSTFQNIDF